MDERLAALDRTLLLFSELIEGDPENIAAALGAARVQIVTSAGAAKAGNTQAAIATLATLLARTGISVEALLPSAPITTPLLHGVDLRCGLESLVADAFPLAKLRPALPRPLLAILLGDAAPVAGCRNLWLSASGQVAGFSSEPSTWVPADALVALPAAGMAANEAIREVLRSLPPVSGAAARELAQIENAHFKVPKIPPGLVPLGSWDCISAGAITNSSLWTLVARGDVEADLRVFDDGRYDLSNLNRYLLMGPAQALAELDKTAHLASLDLGGIRVTPVSRRFGLEDVPSARAQIMIGADDIRVRHTAQRSNPDYLAIGATSHFEVRITQHFAGGPCASCAHPYFNEADDSLIPTLATISFWAGFVLAVFVLAKASGNPIPIEQSYMQFWPLRPGTGQAGPVHPHPACRLGHGSQKDTA